MVGGLPEHQPSAAAETEPLQEEAAVPREPATAPNPAAPDTRATSHTLESGKSAGFAVDFGDTASSGRGVHLPPNRWCESLDLELDCRQVPVFLEAFEKRYVFPEEWLCTHSLYVDNMY